MFGYDGCGVWEEWGGGYKARSVGECVLFSIEKVKLQGFLNSDNLTEEVHKRDFICSALNIEKEGSFYKTFVKKFTSKTYPKNNILFKEGDKSDNFSIIKKGSVELFKLVENNRIKIGILG